MVAEVRQRVSNMAGVTKEEVRIVASSYRICPLGAHIDHQEILKSKFDSGFLIIRRRVVFDKFLQNINAFLNADWSLIEKTRRNTFVPGSQVKALQSLHQNQFARLLTLLRDWRICLSHGLGPSTDQMAICSQNLC
ncbi:hypothetical protein Ahy_A08g041006 [Arachis hypogaea]|uniref:Uncharacterized protein n=1 Tax=Arachis hypogaea TaxID=3818 RepID=A0A445C1B9_ARAHY|nr:hypothetical protein Ahy_A08g041006 [Arachis hypogaea]